YVARGWVPMSREAEAPFVRDTRAPAQFKDFQGQLAELLGDRGAIGRFQSKEKINLPKLILDTDKVERFGQNAIITDRDGTVKCIVHQGKVFKVNPDGKIEGADPRINMYYDKATKKVVMDNGTVHAEFDPATDTTTYDFTNKKTKEKM